MSKLNLKDIIQGWGNVIWMDPSFKEAAEERAAICITCPININNICNLAAGGCGCPIIAATKAPGKTCPQKKWLR